MSSNPQASSNKALFIVLGIVGGVLLLGCLGFVGLFGFMWYALQSRPAAPAFNQIGSEIDAELAAEDFLDAINLGDFEGAYQQATVDFRDRQSLDQFRAFVNQNPGLQNQAGNSTDTQLNLGNQLTLDVTIDTLDGRTIRATIDMVQQAGQWKVDRFTIP